jgi:hypothetical protein
VKIPVVPSCSPNFAVAECYEGKYFCQQGKFMEIIIAFVCCRLVVGGPRGNFTHPQHLNVAEPGAVYHCQLHRDRKCTSPLWLHGYVCALSVCGFISSHRVPNLLSYTVKIKIFPLQINTISTLSSLYLSPSSHCYKLCFGKCWQLLVIKKHVYEFIFGLSYSVTYQRFEPEYIRMQTMIQTGCDTFDHYSHPNRHIDLHVAWK